MLRVNAQIIFFIFQQHGGKKIQLTKNDITVVGGIAEANSDSL